MKTFVENFLYLDLLNPFTCSLHSSHVVYTPVCLPIATPYHPPFAALGMSRSTGYQVTSWLLAGY